MTEISIYRDSLTKTGIAKQVGKIKLAFPTLPSGFYDILTERVSKNEFSDKQLQDSVDNVIDNCIYPTPTIANFMSFDKRIKLYNYNQMLQLNTENISAFKHYKPIEVRFTDVKIWASIEDIDRYNLKIIETNDLLGKSKGVPLKK